MRSALRAQADAAGAAEARGLPGFRLQPLVEIGAVLGEPGEILSGAQLAHQPGGVPGGAARDLAPLQEQHVAPAELRQMVGDAAAGDATTDDHNPRVRRERAGHGTTPTRRGRLTRSAHGGAGVS